MQHFAVREVVQESEGFGLCELLFADTVCSLLKLLGKRNGWIKRQNNIGWIMLESSGSDWSPCGKPKGKTEQNGKKQSDKRLWSTKYQLAVLLPLPGFSSYVWPDMDQDEIGHKAPAGYGSSWL